MSAVSIAGDKIKSRVQEALKIAKDRILGANNEKLDFLMDSFYKLEPNQRTAVLGGVVGAIVVFVLIAIALYFTQINSLKNDLSNSYAALHELQSLRSSYETENANFDQLYDLVSRKASNLKMKPFFEKMANNLGLTILGLNEQRVDLPADNPLSTKMAEVVVDMRLQNISIPRLLAFLIEVEKSGNYIRVRDLQINERYGTKLYFDAQLKMRGYEILR